MEDALKHPTWKMGAKITIDSATLMNKGLEIIEARWLFDVSPDQVQVIVHPQSIVHSMVEYVDGCVIAQLGVADMGIPILYALTYPERRPTPAARLDLTRAGALTFFEPDPEQVPVPAPGPRRRSRTAGRRRWSLNAANEMAVAAFLDRRIGFVADSRADRARPDGLAGGRADIHRAMRDRRCRGAPPRPGLDRRSRWRCPAVTTIVSFVIVIGLLILIHELGHFFVARWTGVGVERFSIGFGPVLLRWKGKETEYCLSADPDGRLREDDGRGGQPARGGRRRDVRSRQGLRAKKPLWARFLIVFAGPGMNLVLAAVIFAVVLGTLGRPVWPAVGRTRGRGRPGRRGRAQDRRHGRRRQRPADHLLGGSRARPVQRPAGGHSS